MPLLEKRSIFLSHTSSDKDQAREIYHELIGHGIDVWLDEAEIPWGGELRQYIAPAIDRVDVLGVLLTPHAVTSRWVLDELRYGDWAQHRGSRVEVLPLLGANCEIPPYLSDTRYLDLRGREFSRNLAYLVDYLLGRSSEIPKPRRLALIELVQNAGRGRWSVWSRGRLERETLVELLRSMTDEEVSDALRLGLPRGDRSEAELVNELSRAIGSAGAGRRAVRRLIETGLLERVSPLGRDGEHYEIGDLAHALQRAALRSGRFTEVARGAPEPERLDELLLWRSPSNQAETYNLSGDGWQAISLGAPCPRAPQARHVELPMGGMRVSGTRQIQERPVHVVVWRHSPPTTWILHGPDDAELEVFPRVLSLEDLGLLDERRLRRADQKHYPEIDLATFDESGRLTELDLEEKRAGEQSV